MRQVSATEIDARDQALLERIQRGDADAFEQLVLAYYPKLLAFAAQLTRSRDASRANRASGLRGMPDVSSVVPQAPLR